MQCVHQSITSHATPAAMNFIFLTSAFRVHSTPFLHSLLPTENETGRDQWIRLLFAIGELCLVLIYEGNQKSTSRLFWGTIRLIL